MEAHWYCCAQQRHVVSDVHHNAVSAAPDRATCRSCPWPRWPHPKKKRLFGHKKRLFGQKSGFGQVHVSRSDTTDTALQLMLLTFCHCCAQEYEGDSMKHDLGLQARASVSARVKRVWVSAPALTQHIEHRISAFAVHMRYSRFVVAVRRNTKVIP